tara:strand:- start:199 stop:1170 length:972 start_codon:yes stop_codon:yes gene_type:complete
METILVTGGLGFIGANFISKILKSDYNIINIDFQTYASIDTKILNFDKYSNYKYFKVNINDFKAVDKIINNFDINKIIHFAAESHVDNSIIDPLLFAKTNILGTLNLLESFKKTKISKKLFVHISTDEVYGSIKNKKFNEESSYLPNSPYSASKASSDHLVRSYYKTFDLPVIITNCCNNFGPYQNKEKLIPTVIKSLILGEKIPVYGTGENIREWIFVGDHIDAIIHLIKFGHIGENYCIGSGNEFSNIELVKYICKVFDKINNSKNSKKLISFIKDRKGHDFRYALDSSKIKKTGWRLNSSFDLEIENTINWYLNNKNFLI